MDKDTKIEEKKRKAAQHEQQQQQQQHLSKQQQQHSQRPSGQQQQQPSSSSSGLAAFSKRTRVCDAEDDETAAEPGPAVKRSNLKEGVGESGAEAKEAVGEVGDGKGEAVSDLTSRQGSTASPSNVMLSLGQASQPTATRSNSTRTGWQKQAGAWLSGGAATAKKSVASASAQPTTTAALNNTTSADGSLPSLPPLAPEVDCTSLHPRMSQSYVFPSIYANGIHWHLIVPPGPPPSEAGDVQAFEVVRIPVISGGPSSFNGVPSTLDPPFAQVDPAGCHIAIVDGYVRYNFDEPLVGNPLGGEERYKVHVTRTLTPQGKQLLLRELKHPQPSVPFATVPPTLEQQQSRPRQASLSHLPTTSSFPGPPATTSTPVLQGPAQLFTGPAAAGASTPNLVPNGALITELSSSSSRAPASPPRSAASAAQGAPPGPSALVTSSASTGASASAVAAVARQGNEQVTAPAIGGQQAATSTAGVQEADEAVASAQNSPAAASERLPSMWRPVSWTPEPITDPELLAKLRERMKRTEGRGPGWSPTPTPEPESPKGEESSCTSGHKAGHDQESAKGSHEGGGMMAKRNGDDGDRDGGGAG